MKTNVKNDSLLKLMTEGRALIEMGRPDESKKIFNQVFKPENLSEIVKIMERGVDFSICSWCAFGLGRVIHTKESLKSLLRLANSHNLTVRRAAFIGLLDFKEQGAGPNDIILLKNIVLESIYNDDFQVLNFSLPILDGIIDKSDVLVIEKILIRYSEDVNFWEIGIGLIYKIDKLCAIKIIDEKITYHTSNLKRIKDGMS